MVHDGAVAACGLLATEVALVLAAAVGAHVPEAAVHGRRVVYLVSGLQLHPLAALVGGAGVLSRLVRPRAPTLGRSVDGVLFNPCPQPPGPR